MLIGLLGTAFVGALLGSGHCAGMCGPFVMISNGFKDDDAGADRWRTWVITSWYNLGRLATYLTLGLFAGLFGSLLESSGSLVGLQQASILFAGLTLVIIGLVGFLRISGVRVPLVSLSPFFQPMIHRLVNWSRSFSGKARAFGLGAASSLLPCGWLYVFVIASISAGSWMYSPLVMAAFWLGTLPIMTALGWGSSWIWAGFRRQAKWIMPAAMMVIGISSIWNRAAIADTALPGKPDGASIVQEMESLSPADVPCGCHEND